MGAKVISELTPLELRFFLKPAPRRQLIDSKATLSTKYSLLLKVA